MYQTLQCTGMQWCIHLHTPLGITKCLGYGSFSNVVSNIIPSVTLKVLPDGVYLCYITKIREIKARERKAGIIN